MKIIVCYAIALNFILTRQGQVSCFIPSYSPTHINSISRKISHQQGQDQHQHLRINQSKNVQTETKLNLSAPSFFDAEQLELQQLTVWITAFSSLHIGMSAIRDTLIQACGRWAENANLIDRKMLTLPSWWPGDDVGRNEIFPDADTAGRQIYRLGYTFVSFLTLGGALSTYLSIVQSGGGGDGGGSSAILTDEEHMIYFSIASASFAASIASLFNASPLSLMPGFQKVEEEKNGEQILTTASTFSSESTIRSRTSTIGGLQRNDGLKFEPKGLTRITRHPLILPVVPWGFSTAMLLGGNTADFIFLGGLSIYAIAGCACQDLRVSRREGSVGTVFNPVSTGEVGNQLDDFFSKTSFVPFAAIVDGRQPIGLMLKEFPFLPLVIGFPIGGIIEENLIRLLRF